MYRARHSGGVKEKNLGERSLEALAPREPPAPAPLRNPGGKGWSLGDCVLQIGDYGALSQLSLLASFLFLGFGEIGVGARRSRREFGEERG